MFKVFVYGTLKPSYSNYLLYCEGRVSEEIKAVTEGKLYHLPNFGYPAMVKGEGKVKGYLLTFVDDEILAELDGLEDYHPNKLPQENFYQRRLIDVRDLAANPLGQVWAYFMDWHKVQKLGGVFVPSGCWEGR
jgi:gamma-glutamylcyclotransferase (GGCT)/AIG2-like uncharacterized protein YtfP